MLQFHKSPRLLFPGAVLLKIPENMAGSSVPSKTYRVQISRGQAQRFTSLSCLSLPLATFSVSLYPVFSLSSLSSPFPSLPLPVSPCLSLTHAHTRTQYYKTRPAGRGSQLGVRVPSSVSSCDIRCQQFFLKIKWQSLQIIYCLNLIVPIQEYSCNSVAFTHSCSWALS